MNLKRRGLEIARRLAGEIVQEGAEIVREEIVGVMRSSTPGGHTDKEGYTSSAPGEPPAYGKGVYAGSWQVSPAQEEDLWISASAFTDLIDPETGRNVGVGLEWGDENNLPRPHVRPGLELARPRIRQMIREKSRGRR